MRLNDNDVQMPNFTFYAEDVNKRRGNILSLFELVEHSFKEFNCTRVPLSGNNHDGD